MRALDKMVVFEGAKIDGRRVHIEREPQGGRVSAVEGFLSGPLGGAPEEAASQFLDANQRLFESRRGSMRELQLQKVSRSPAGYHVVFQQMHQGVPVEEGIVSVHLTTDKRVHAAQIGVDPRVTELNVRDVARNGIDRDEAVHLALGSMGGSANLARPAEAEQVILTDKEPTLTWRISFATSHPAADWIVWLDAVTGVELRRREVAMH